MTYRIVFNAPGGPEVLSCEEIQLPEPAAGEIRVRHEAIGVNFIDIYHRTGLYPLPTPSGLGIEAAGMVEAVGPAVTAFMPGDRVGYVGPIGAYASARNLDAGFAMRLPDTISSEVAAAALAKGTTAEFLVERCAKMSPGQTALVHAAAGGVGSILVQWLKAIGVRTLAHAGNEHKAKRARSLGADAVSFTQFEQLPAWVQGETNGAGVDVVFDGIGAASWQASLASVRRRGLIVSYGNASGPVAPFSMLDLAKAGSVFVTRPVLGDYSREPEEAQASSARLFAMIASGKITVDIAQHFSLKNAGAAHMALEARQTIGSTLLIP